MALAERLRRLRVAHGMALEDLAAHLGGVVTKQALSKYERAEMRPSPLVLTRLAKVFNLKVADLNRAPNCSVDFIAYRKGSGLTASQQEQIEARVSEALQQRVALQEMLGELGGMDLPERQQINSLEDCEAVATKVRKEWKLGCAPIANLVATLEARRIHVIEVEASEKFDGISALAKCDGTTVAAATASKSGTCGDRQRLTLGHELGHLVLAVPKSLDEEAAAYRFGAAFLAPSDEVRAAVGTKRSSVSVFELLSLKQLFGISAQALLRRLADLNIISNDSYRLGWVQFNRLGMRKKEPNELPAEKPQWLERAALRAQAENLLSPAEAKKLLGDAAMEIPSSLLQRKTFMKLPLEQRRQLLAEQASKLAADYEAEADGLGEGDFVDG